MHSVTGCEYLEERFFYQQLDKNFATDSPGSRLAWLSYQCQSIRARK